MLEFTAGISIVCGAIILVVKMWRNGQIVHIHKYRQSDIMTAAKKAATINKRNQERNHG